MSYEQDAGGVRVSLSAPQLAAVLTRKSISQTEMLSNRLWGGLQVVGGVLEMVGAAALCVLPEPTMASKAGCVVFGVHGSDATAAGLRQIWTGRDTVTLTQQGTTKLAEAMKIDPAMANNIGLSLDIAVPFGFAGSIKAARVARVTVGRIRLDAHEARAGSRLGGHTLEKHVGRTEAELRERLAREGDRKVVTSFASQDTAEWAISRVVQANTSQLKAWLQSSPNYPLVLTGNVGQNVGYGVVRATGKLVPMSKLRIILRCKQYNGMPFYILTSYLEL
jgi:hypothetical protein